MRPALGPVGLALAAFLLAGAAAGAEERAAPGRLEVEGVAAVTGAEDPGPGVLRERALRAGVARAVDDVALDLLADSPRVPPDFDSAALDAVLGADRRDYALAFRLLEDRGLRPPGVAAGPEVEAEYAVRVQVHVDVAGVRRRLEAAGLLEAARRPTATQRSVRVVLEPVGSWAALAWVREALEAGGAGPATPLELEPGRAVLGVRSALGPRELLGTLRREAPPGLHLSLRGLDAEELVLAVEADGLGPPDARGDEPAAPRGGN